MSARGLMLAATPVLGTITMAELKECGGLEGLSAEQVHAAVSSLYITGHFLRLSRGHYRRAK